MSTVSPLSAVRASVSATTLHKRLVLSWPSLLFLFLLPVHPKVEQITAVFTAATRQKAWDHFSKAQRKNIDIWRKQCEVGIPLFVFFCFLLPPWLTAFFSAVTFESPGESWGLTHSPVGFVVFSVWVVVLLDASPSQTDRRADSSLWSPGPPFIPAAPM